MAEVISHLVRMPANGRETHQQIPPAFRSKVVDSVVSVLCRMRLAFREWTTASRRSCSSARKRPLRFGRSQCRLWATRKSISRIRQGGPNTAVYLGLVTQVRAESTATHISTGNTLFLGWRACQ